MNRTPNFRVLIVDDEPIVREGMKTIIPWEEYGYSVCGVAADGNEGLRQLRELSPDVAIVDIRMPGIDGLKLSELAHVEGLPTKIILLTGYSQFEYARSALRYGVKSYLLKPVEEEELIRELGEIYEALTQEKRQERLLTNTGELLFDQFIGEMIQFGFHEELSERLNQLCHGAFPWQSYQVVLLHTPEKISSAEQQSQLKQLFEAEQWGLGFRSTNWFGILVRDRVLEPQKENAERLYQRIFGVVGPCGLILGSPCDSIRDIPVSYESAVGLAEFAFLMRAQRFIDSSIVEQYLEDNSKKYAGNLIADIVAFAHAGDRNAVSHIIDDLKNYILEYKLSDLLVRAFYVNILVCVYNSLDMILPDTGEGSTLFDIYVINEKIIGMTNIQDVENYAKAKLLHWMDKRHIMRTTVKIAPILEYINASLDRDIRLESLARQFGYNSAYLGKLFRDCTGEYFNSYVDRLKMGKAKELIRGGSLIYEAAEKVGYTNINYFYVKFKKYTGVSPGTIKKNGDRKNMG